MKQRTMPWRVLVVPPRSGAENMARDTGLMDRARDTGETVFSIYEWEIPTLSLGRNQAAAGRYDLERMRALGMDVVRRPTGGRALLHHREITYSVAGPARDHETLGDTYGRINSLLVRGLLELGVRAEQFAENRPPERPGLVPCFAAPAAGELVVEGGKLVGSAQVRENRAFLQHGSILVEDDQHLVAEVTLRPDFGSVPRAATLSDALGRLPRAQEVADAMFAALRETEDPGAASISEEETRGYTMRHADRYRSELWTWRK